MDRKDFVVKIETLRLIQQLRQTEPGKVAQLQRRLRACLAQANMDAGADAASLPT